MGRTPQNCEKKKTMKEDFLHYVWQNRHYDFLNLKTTDGRNVKVVFPGYHNHDAGPDFLQAVVGLSGCFAPFLEPDYLYSCQK